MGLNYIWGCIDLQNSVPKLANTFGRDFSELEYQGQDQRLSNLQPFSLIGLECCNALIACRPKSVDILLAS